MVAKRVIGVEERRARLAHRHRLLPDRRTDDVLAIADDLVALHSSDPVTPHLSAAARMRNPSVPSVSAGLYEDRSLLRHHAMRRTLWVFSLDNARLAHASSTTSLTGPLRRRFVRVLEDNEVAEDGARWLERACQQVVETLDALGSATTREVGERLPELRIPLSVPGATIKAHTRILSLLGFEGAIVRAEPTGSWVNSQYRWSLMEEWLPGGVGGIEPSIAASELAERWLRSFGPASTDDLKWWTGWTATATRRALETAKAVEVDVGGSDGWVAGNDLDPPPEPAPWVAFLPGLDPTAMGWKQRDFYLAPDHVKQLFDRNGNAGPTVWVDGRIVGGWVQRQDGTIAYQILEDLGTERMPGIEAAAHDLEKLLGETRFRVRFPAPLQRTLYS